MVWKRGKGIGFVIVMIRPTGSPVALTECAGSQGKVGIFTSQEAAGREARRLQDESRNPWILPAELVLAAEPDVLI